MVVGSHDVIFFLVSFLPVIDITGWDINFSDSFYLAVTKRSYCLLQRDVMVLLASNMLGVSWWVGGSTDTQGYSLGSWC
jgi:hypothetical protein